MKCLTCHSEIEHIAVTVDPRTAELAFRANCSHELSSDAAHTAWRGGKIAISPVPFPKITGASLIAAERARQITEEGHTPEADAELPSGVLAWAAWSLIDSAGADHPVEQAPAVWPLPRDRWPATTSPLRRLTIAGALIAAEIDRRRASGETP
jgi:hypothetical protein